MRFRFAAAILASACTRPGVCDYPTPVLSYCDEPPMPDAGSSQCAGELLAPTTWQSNPLGSGWVEFPPAKTVLMHLRDAQTKQVFAAKVYEIKPYVATDRLGSDSTLASGNLALVRPLPSTHEWCPNSNGSTSCILVENATCVPMFLRVVVRGEP